MIIDITSNQARLIIRNLAQTAKHSKQPKRDLTDAEEIGRKIKQAAKREKQLTGNLTKKGHRAI